MTLELKAFKRTEIKKNKVKQIRSEDKIPAVVYGLNKDPLHITVERREFEKVLKQPKGRNTIFTLDIEGHSESVITHDISKDAISLKILHIDFLRVDDQKPVRVDVPLKIVGNAPGLRLGGLLLHKLRRVVLKCKPADIPDVVNVDVSELGLDQYIQVKDLSTENGKYTFLTNSSDTILQLISSRKGETTEAAETATSA